MKSLTKEDSKAVISSPHIPKFRNSMDIQSETELSVLKNWRI